MELIHFFSVLGRNIGKILLGSVLCALLAALLALTVVPDGYKTTITFSTGVKVDHSIGLDKYDPLSYFDSADKFADTILGWFRSPISFDEIEEKVNEGDIHLDKILNIRKQEKQNLNIGFTLGSQELAKKVKDATMQYLDERIANINERTNTNYELVSQSYKIEKEKASPLIYALIAFGVMFLVLTVYVYLYEYISHTVSFREQIEDTLGIPLQGKIKKQRGDIEYLGEMMMKHKTSFLIMTSKKQPEFIIKLVQYLTMNREQKILLIEGTKHNTLRELFSLQKTIAKTKGFFDSDVSLGSVILPISQDLPKAHILGRGQGSSAQLKALDKLSSEYDHIIILSSFPEGMYVLEAQSSLVVPLITLGQTKIKDIRVLRELQESKIIPMELV